MVFFSTIFLYPSKEIIEAELDSSQYCKLKVNTATERTKKVLDNVDNMDSKTMNYPLERFENCFTKDDPPDINKARFSESPLASKYTQFFGILNKSEI